MIKRPFLLCPECVNADAVHDRLDAVDLVTKREIIRGLVKRVEIHKDEILVVFRVDPDPGFNASETSTGSGPREKSMQDRTQRNDSPLRGSCLRCEQGSLIDILSSKPFTQHHFIHGYVGEQPIVADIVKTASNVTLKYPLRRTTFRQCIKTMCDCIGRGSLWPKSI